MRRIECFALAVLSCLLLPRLGWADSAIVVGAGAASPWGTTLEFANPTDAPLEFAVSVFPEGPTICAFPVCPFFSESLPPHGTLSVAFRPFADDFPLEMIFITPAEGLP